MKKIRNIAIVLAAMLLLLPLCAQAKDGSELNICRDASGREGVQNELGEWIIPPIYDMISYNDEVYWVFLERDEGRTPLMGLIDMARGIAIPAHYDEIRVGDELVVAYDATMHLYDIFDQEWRLIYTMPCVYDYVLPNGAAHLDVADIDANYFTIPVPRYGVPAD